MKNLLRGKGLRATSGVQTQSATDPKDVGGWVGTGHGFGWLAVDDGVLWATNTASRTVTQIALRDGEVRQRTELSRAPAAIAVGTKAVWVICTNGWLWRFRRGGEGEGVASLASRPRGIACDRHSVFVLHADGSLVGVQQATGATTFEARVPRGGRQLIHADGRLLALCRNGRQVCRLSPHSGRLEARCELPARGVRAALHGRTLWVACGSRLRSGWGALLPVDPTTMSAGPPVALPGAPRAIAAGSDHLWLACGRRGDGKSPCFRVDPRSTVTERWAGSEWPVYDLAVDGERLLAATGTELAGPALWMGGEGATGAGPWYTGGHGGGYGWASVGGGGG